LRPFWESEAIKESSIQRTLGRHEYAYYGTFVDSDWSFLKFPSPPRIEKQIAFAFRASARRCSAVIHAIRSHAVKQPVHALRTVNQRLAAEWIDRKPTKIIWNKFPKACWWPASLESVTAQGEFSGQQAQACTGSLMNQLGAFR